MRCRWQFDVAYRRCSHLSNASKAAPTTALLLFRQLPVAGGLADRWVRLPAWCFLLALYMLTRLKCIFFELEAWDSKTDRRTAGRIAVEMATTVLRMTRQSLNMTNKALIYTMQIDLGGS